MNCTHCARAIRLNSFDLLSYCRKGHSIWCKNRKSFYYIRSAGFRIAFLAVRKHWSKVISYCGPNKRRSPPELTHWCRQKSFDIFSRIKLGKKTYNTSFYGCVLWDLFSKEAERLEKTWNVSQRLMLGLSRESHRYFIEPISETRHIIFHIYKRFVKFLSQMTSSRKGILRSLCNVVMNDCQSTTGRNLRRLQLLFNSGSFTELQRDVKTNRAYQEADVNDLWKIEAVKDLTKAMYDNTILPNFTRDEISDIRDHIATYWRSTFIWALNHCVWRNKIN